MPILKRQSRASLDLIFAFNSGRIIVLDHIFIYNRNESVLLYPLVDFTLFTKSDILVKILATKPHRNVNYCFLTCNHHIIRITSHFRPWCLGSNVQCKGIHYWRWAYLVLNATIIFSLTNARAISVMWRKISETTSLQLK